MYRINLWKVLIRERGTKIISRMLAVPWNTVKATMVINKWRKWSITVTSPRTGLLSKAAKRTRRTHQRGHQESYSSIKGAAGTFGKSCEVG